MVVPSVFESFGLVLLEAMILKTQVVSTATTGSIWLTDKDKYDILVDNIDKGIEDGMCRCLDE